MTFADFVGLAYLGVFPACLIYGLGYNRGNKAGQDDSAFERNTGREVIALATALVDTYQFVGPACTVSREATFTHKSGRKYQVKLSIGSPPVREPVS
jgi:hypothetical protein